MSTQIPCPYSGCDYSVDLRDGAQWLHDLADHAKEQHDNYAYLSRAERFAQALHELLDEHEASLQAVSVGGAPCLRVLLEPTVGTAYKDGNTFRIIHAEGYDLPIDGEGYWNKGRMDLLFERSEEKPYGS